MIRSYSIELSQLIPPSSPMHFTTRPFASTLSAVERSLAHTHRSVLVRKRRAIRHGCEPKIAAAAILLNDLLDVVHEHGVTKAGDTQPHRAYRQAIRAGGVQSLYER